MCLFIYYDVPYRQQTNLLPLRDEFLFVIRTVEKRHKVLSITKNTELITHAFSQLVK